MSVRNFRSVESADLDCTPFNVFVGQNNSGKTNLFEAISWFYNGTPKGVDIDELKYRRESGREISVEIEFVGAQQGAQSMRSTGGRTKMLEVLGEEDSITVRRTSEDPKKREIEVAGTTLERPPTGFDKAFNDFLPKFEFVGTRQYFDALAKYTARTPIGIMLSSVLETILEGNQQYAEFRDKFAALFDDEESDVRVEFDKLGDAVRNHLEKQFSETSSVRFSVTTPEFDDLLKGFETTVDDGVETLAAEKGDGMQRALMLAIIQAYADFRKSREDAGKAFLFFIDEAELHLHPTAQRRLKNVLLELCADLDQVFMNTHSSVFVADDDPVQTLCRVEKEDGATSFLPVDEVDKPYVVYELLGGSPADLLLPRNFLIVEGPSEQLLLKEVIRRFYRDQPPIQIVSAEGDTHQATRTINAIRKAFAPLMGSIYADRLVLLCDHPTDAARGGFDAFVGEHPELEASGRLHVLPEASLEQCYPDTDDWKKDAVQVKRLDGTRKKQLAQRVGSAIEKAQFEGEMGDVYQALLAAWENAL